jgi:hypothetical protein
MYERLREKQAEFGSKTEQIHTGRNLYISGVAD